MSVTLVDEQRRVTPTPRLRRLAAHVLAAEGVPDTMELTVLLVDEPAMTELNGRHMGASGPTDVLAFPIDAPGEATGGVPAVLGDVVLCPAVAARQADADAGEVAELELLLVHGVLHLLGHDHAEADERRVMFARTDALLAAFRDPAGAPAADRPQETG